MILPTTNFQVHKKYFKNVYITLMYCPPVNKVYCFQYPEKYIQRLNITDSSELSICKTKKGHWELYIMFYCTLASLF